MIMHWKDFVRSFVKYINHKGLFVFEVKTEKFYHIENGDLETLSIPETIKDNLYKEDVSVSFFRKNSKILIFYFLRVYFDNTKLVFVIQDDSKRNKISSVLKGLIEFSSISLTDLNQIEKEVELLREELSECEKEVTFLDDKRIKHEEEISSKNLEIDSLSESVNVLRYSREKMLKLIDGLNSPLFSMDMEYELVNINKAVGDFVDNDNLPQFIGCKCYKMIFNFDGPCDWCPVEKVLESKQNHKQHIHVESGEKEYTLEQVIYPIFDTEGNIVEVGEFLNDITEQYTLVKSLEKSQEKVKKISKDRINSLHEVNSIKKEYNDLYAEYEKIQASNKKLSKTLEKILEQDSTKELLQLRSENKDLRTKVGQLRDSINNYKELTEQDSGRVNDLTKRSLFAIERMTNIINNRKKIEDKDLKNIFNFINGQIDYLKDLVNKKEENDDSESSN